MLKNVWGWTHMFVCVCVYESMWLCTCIHVCGCGLPVCIWSEYKCVYLGDEVHISVFRYSHVCLIYGTYKPQKYADHETWNQGISRFTVWSLGLLGLHMTEGRHPYATLKRVLIPFIRTLPWHSHLPRACPLNAILGDSSQHVDFGKTKSFRPWKYVSVCTVSTGWSSRVTFSLWHQRTWLSILCEGSAPGEPE